ncbi:MAG: hypothetical protein KJ736_05695 [Candidatus Omnitrophica bacterium]|nr:hypothetical protein [Candidatus Omnitrophota bacterium]
MKVRKTIFIIILTFAMEYSAFATDMSKIYKKAESDAKGGHADFAFMGYRKVLSANPKESYKQQALFAVAEYYYKMSDHKNSAKYFKEYLKVSKDENGRLFAFVYLMKLAKIEKNESLIVDLESEIKLVKRNSFIFDNTKEYSFESPLNRNHRAVYYIDKIEFYVEKENIASIFF